MPRDPASTLGVTQSAKEKKKRCRKMKIDSRYFKKKKKKKSFFYPHWRGNCVVLRIKQALQIYRSWRKIRGRCGRSRLPPPSGGPSSRLVPRRHPAQSYRRRSRSGDPSCAPGDPLSTRLYRLARCLTSSPGWFQLPEGQRAGQHLQVIYSFIFFACTRGEHWRKKKCLTLWAVNPFLRGAKVCF